MSVNAYLTMLVEKDLDGNHGHSSTKNFGN
jgi:hypothetical protein